MLEEILSILDRLDSIYYKKTKSCNFHILCLYGDWTGHVKHKGKRIISFKTLEECLERLGNYLEELDCRK